MAVSQTRMAVSQTRMSVSQTQMAVSQTQMAVSQTRMAVSQPRPSRQLCRLVVDSRLAASAGRRRLSSRLFLCQYFDNRSCPEDCRMSRHGYLGCRSAPVKISQSVTTIDTAI